MGASSLLQAFLSIDSLLEALRFQSSHAGESCQDCLRTSSSQILTRAFEKFSVLQSSPLLSCLLLVLLHFPVGHSKSWPRWWPEGSLGPRDLEF